MDQLFLSSILITWQVSAALRPWHRPLLACGPGGSILRYIYLGMAIEGFPRSNLEDISGQHADGKTENEIFRRVGFGKKQVLFLETPQLFIGSLIYESNLIVQDIGGIWNYLEPYYGGHSCHHCRSLKFLFSLRIACHLRQVHAVSFDK